MKKNVLPLFVAVCMAAAPMTALAAGSSLTEIKHETSKVEKKEESKHVVNVVTDAPKAEKPAPAEKTETPAQNAETSAEKPAEAAETKKETTKEIKKNDKKDDSKHIVNVVTDAPKAEQPKEQPAETPAKPADDPTLSVEEMPIEEPEAPAEKPAETPAEQPADKADGVPANTPEAPAKTAFSDVKESDANYAAIMMVASNGWMSGISDTEFGADKTLTRAMAVTVLWNKAGKPEAKEAGKFVDVAADAYYAKAVVWAAEKGITAGYDETTFGPDDVVTTNQFTIMLARANGVTPEAYAGGAPEATRGWVAEQLVK